MGFLDKFKGKKTAPPAKQAKPGKAGLGTAGKDVAAPAKEKEATKQTRGPLAKEGAGHAYRLLLAPVLTEKSANLQAQGKYVFLVAPSAGKVEIAMAVRDLYGIKPVSVRIVKLEGKKVRFGRFTGRQKSIKKAIVTLPPGQTITMFEGA